MVSNLDRVFHPFITGSEKRLCILKQTWSYKVQVWMLPPGMSSTNQKMTHISSKVSSKGTNSWMKEC